MRPDTFNSSPIISLAEPNVVPRKMYARKPVRKGERQLKRAGRDAEVCATALSSKRKPKRVEWECESLSVTFVEEGQLRERDKAMQI